MSFLDKLREKSSEIATAITDVVEKKYVSFEIKEKRLAICNGCRHHIKATNSCTRCGCFLGLKTELEHSKCPLNKW